MMKSRRFLTYLLIGFLLLGAAAAIAGNSGYGIDWWSISGGSESMSGGPYHLAGSAAEISAGPEMSGGEYTLTGGFWSVQEEVTAQEFRQYIPLVIRQ